MFSGSANAGMGFIAQFFLFRVVIASYYWWVMVVTVKERFKADIPGWAWSGMAVFGMLCQLNIYWFCKLVSAAAGTLTEQQLQAPGTTQAVIQRAIGSMDGSIGGLPDRCNAEEYFDLDQELVNDANGLRMANAGHKQHLEVRQEQGSGGAANCQQHC